MSTITQIRDAIATKLASTGIKVLGFYPDDIQNIGNHYPSCAIEIGSESDYEPTMATTVSDLQVQIYVYTNTIINKAIELAELQDSILSTLMADPTLNGTAYSVQAESIDRGELATELDYYNIGYSDGLNVGTVSIVVRRCRNY